MDQEAQSGLRTVLGSILTPLSSLSDLAHVHNIRDAVDADPTISFSSPLAQSQIPRKRPRSALPSTLLDNFQASVQSLRDSGGNPDTLFFPECPRNVSDSTLVDVVRVAVRAIKRVSKKGGDKVLLWMAFYEERDCLEAWKRIMEWIKGRHGFRIPIIHCGIRIGEDSRSGRGDGVTKGKSIGAIEGFRKKRDKVLKEGGLGNTLLFRLIPMEVSIEEFEGVVNEGADVEERAIKLRTAESKGGVGTRNMWVVFAMREVVEKRFIALSGKRVSFRCGKCVDLKPMLHNDASDADTKKRRLREKETMIQTPSKSHGRPGGLRKQNSHKESLEKLEEFLQRKPELCPFMNKKSRQGQEMLQDLVKLW